MAQRRMEEDLKYNNLRLVTPAIEGPNGPMNHTQPALDGELPEDPLGYIPSGEER
jgi:hypothetical protein